MDPAKKRLNLKEDLTCAICCDLFTDPVMLACMHHFCKACITTYWRGIRAPVSCPQCRKVFPNRRFQINYLVAGLVEKVRASSSDGQQKLLKKQLKDSLESHLSKRASYTDMICREREKMDEIKRAGAELLGRVQSDFQALHQVLREEEASLVEQLRSEQENMREVLGRHLELLEVAVAEAEENVRTLQRTIDSLESSALVEIPEENYRSCVEVGTEPQIDTNAFRSKYEVPLQYILWRKMFALLKPGLAPLTFDVETAHPSLILSQDKMSVVHCDEMLPCKRNWKRFTQCVNVLGAQGFRSGRHYWEVWVGAKTKWDLGVALEAVDRQSRVKLCPENGYWAIRLRGGNEYSAGTQPWSRLPLVSPIRRVGIFLDFEAQRVSFFNAECMQLLYSFANGPQGPALPFFSTCLGDKGLKAQPIRLVHFPLEAL